MPTIVEIPDVPHLDAARFAELISHERTALLVIDIQHDFVAPGGFCDRVGADLAAMPAAIDAIERMIGAARDSGIAIVFMRLVTRADTDSPSMLRLMERRGRSGGASLCRADGNGADYHRVAPQPGDIEIVKRRFDAFLETDLDARLRARGIQSVIVTGVSTDCCVDSTSRAAFQRDYDVFVVSDACAAGSPALHLGALAALERNVALLVDSQSAVSALATIGDRS